MHPYSHKDIEKKWQERWEAEGAGVARENTEKEKSYLLVEFPYPSGAGLHAGHVRSYTAMDIVARKRRREGKEVLYPIGWDAFGLPTENYAIKTGRNPREVTKENTDTFRRQLKMLGISFDWSREINTTDPAYYRWTQWIFLQLFNKGLAYKAKTQINWCPKCKIGLANEEVVEGACERCGYAPVEKREKEQWMLKITEYAGRLYDDLDTVDYIPRAKVQQRNWIGPSEGAELSFEIKMQNAKGKNTSQNGKVTDDLSVYNFVLLHAYRGTPESDWYQWLQKELEKRGATVCIPALPDTENPNQEAQVTEALQCTFNEHTILIGHSLGSVIALSVLEKVKTKIAGCIMVGGFCDPHFKDKERPFEKTFSWDFNWNAIRNNVAWARVLQDTHDPIISIDQAHELAKHLETDVLFVDAQEQHFNSTSAPEVFNTIVSSLAPSTYNLAPITVFTTRPDTLFGATYLVLAPEHALIAELCETNAEGRGIENKEEVLAYVAEAKKKTDIERTAEGKGKSGVELKGIKAIHPATKEEIPVWVADYVLASYGTGAIMAVPAHDERDWEFAKTYGLPLRPVIRFTSVDPENPPREGKEDVYRRIVHVVVRNKKGETLLLKWKGEAWDEMKRWPVSFLVGGIEMGESLEEAARREVREEAGFTNLRHIETLPVPARVQFYAAHKNVNRTADVYTVVFELVDDSQEPISEEEQAKHDIVFVPDGEVGMNLNIPDDKYFWQQITNPKPFTETGLLINSGQFDGLSSEEAKQKITAYVGGKMVTKYKLRDWVFSRQRYWGEPIPMVHCEKCGWVCVPEKDLPVMLPEVEKYEPTDTGESPLANIREWVQTTCPQCGGAAKRETDVMPNWAGSSWYYLRYTDPHNTQEFAARDKLSYWLCSGKKAGIPFPEDQVKASGAIIQNKQGEYIFQRRTHDAPTSPGYLSCFGGQKEANETSIDALRRELLEELELDIDTNSDTIHYFYAVPSRSTPRKLLVIFLITGVDDTKLVLHEGERIEKFTSLEELKKQHLLSHHLSAMPCYDPQPEIHKNHTGGVDWYNGGMEHTTLHLLYSRFWHKFLFDIGAVPTPEPYAKRTSHGIILAEDGEKMSKSKGNVVNPDEIVERFGADTLRVYEMFMGPFEQAIAWSTDGLVGARRFLERVERLSGKVAQQEKEHAEDSATHLLMHQTIKKVTSDIEHLKMNTAISQLMIFTGALEKLPVVPSSSYQTLILLLAPFAPHLAEELWERTGGAGSVHSAPWPRFDPERIAKSEVTIAVQVNGKLRGTLSAGPDIEEAEVAEKARAIFPVAQALLEKEVRKVIFVKGKIINFLTG